jgi:hypothetical protein
LRICCIALTVGGLSSLVLDFIGYRVYFLPPSRACSIRFWGFIRACQKHWLVGIKCVSTWSAWLLGEKWHPLFLTMEFFISIEQKVKNLNFLPPCFFCPFSYHLQFCFPFLHLIVCLKQLGFEPLHHTMCTADGIDCFADVIDFIVLANQIISTARIALICMPESFRECWTCHLFM